MGILVATEGMKIAVKKALKNGVGMVSINHSNHCGMLADYIKYATDNNCIAIAVTNAPSSMPPWGGMESFFGTNPIAYGVPRGNENPIIFDMATSVVARGKIRLAQKNNMKIPIGWALSKDGKQTDDPNVALDGGAVLPVGGHKGYGLAFFVEVLSGIMSGASYGPYLGTLYEDKIQNIGHFFLVFKADLFIDLKVFKSRMDQMSNEVKEIAKAEGFDEIYLPGELESVLYKKRSEKGIPLTQEVYSELESLTIN
jgi:ureidoglycolate dehydrogenase (NAD+)